MACHCIIPILSKYMGFGAGYTSNLAVRLIQEFDIKQSIANRLTSAFGGRAYVSAYVRIFYIQHCLI